jgi:ATP-binding protein involved in chromosome partitioning
VALLGSVPLSIELRESGDRGRPLVIENDGDPAAKEIERIAHEIAIAGKSRKGMSLPLSRKIS